MPHRGFAHWLGVIIHWRKGLISFGLRFESDYDGSSACCVASSTNIPTIHSYRSILLPPMTATLLILNMHCPSCTSYITHLLDPFLVASSILDLDISLLDHTVSFEPQGRNRHFKERVVNKVARALQEDGGFEIDGLSLPDRVASPLAAQKQGILHTWFKYLSSTKSTLDPQLASVPNNQLARLQRHIENCSVCQEGRPQDSAVDNDPTGKFELPFEEVTPQDLDDDEDERKINVVIQPSPDSEIREATYSIAGMTCS